MPPSARSSSRSTTPPTTTPPPVAPTRSAGSTRSSTGSTRRAPSGSPTPRWPPSPTRSSATAPRPTATTWSGGPDAVTMPYYASPEQLMRDRSEYARKGISRGRSVAVLTYADGVLFIAENPSSTLHKVGELYDRIGFAAVGRYSEFESLRVAGVRLADVRGYSYNRRDVTGRVIANAYAQTLGEIFTQQTKPFEVELCVAEVGDRPENDQLYRLTFDGSIVDEPDFVVMGGQADAVTGNLREHFHSGMGLSDALEVGVRALSAVSPVTAGASNGGPRRLPAAL